MGAVFDWRYELVTCEPEFYRWNQWMFLRFLEAGLAYRRMSPVDWCPNDGTLAREQVEGADRHCWRCGAPVEKRDLEQWYLRTTKYADELLDFTGIDWPEPIRLQQTNWIGRSEGARDRLHDRARRPPARWRRAARVHDPARHAVRRDVHGARPGAPARREADGTRATGGGRGLRRPGRRARPRSSGCRPSARRPASTSAPMRSTRSTASASRSGSPTTCCPATGRARSWPCPPTTSATSRSPASSGCRSGGSSRRPERPTTSSSTTRTSPTRPTSGWSTPGRFSGMPAPDGMRAIVDWLAEDGRAQADRHLPPARLAVQPAALLGHADPGHLLRARRHRARPRRGPAGPAARHGRLPAAAARTR